MLYLDAARALRPRQLLTRPRRLLPPVLLAAGLKAPHAPRVEPVASGLGVDVAPPSGPFPAPHLDSVFRAFGAERSFPQASFWRDPADGLLFLFHLHGFRPLAAYAAAPAEEVGDAFWRSVIESWLAEGARPGLPAWHPYPTSLRLISWASAVSGIERWPEDFRRLIARELWRQGAYLRRTVEHDIGGNHVVKNATALCFAGAVLPASGLLDAGLRLLSRELPRQILSDGGHEERSTSYHREVLHDLDQVSELLRRTGREEPDSLLDAITRAGGWQRAIAGPDGRLPLLNDAWEGPPLDEPQAGEALGDVAVLRESGYVVLRHGGDQAVLDIGPLCPPHLPPHAHADALSFVLWSDGKPIAVDPGAASYHGASRDAFRATAAHNTVEVDRSDQCVFWGDFRARLLPRVHGPAVRREHGIVIVEGSHDGYRRLGDPVIHHRAFLWWPGVGVVIVDRLGCAAPHEVYSRICLAPGLHGDDPTRLGDLSVQTIGAGGTTSIESRGYSPALGFVQATKGLCWCARVSPREPFGWALLRPGVSVLVNADATVTLTRDDAPAILVSLSVV
jgi:hypothetical protein